MDSAEWRKYRPNTWDTPGRKLHLWKGRILVERRKVPEYFTDDYRVAYDLYSKWRMFGLPFSGGWAEQPAYLLRIIETFEVVRQIYEAYRSEQSGNSGRAASSSRRPNKKRR